MWYLLVDREVLVGAKFGANLAIEVIAILKIFSPSLGARAAWLASGSPEKGKEFVGERARKLLDFGQKKTEIFCGWRRPALRAGRRIVGASRRSLLIPIGCALIVSLEDNLPQLCRVAWLCCAFGLTIYI